MADSSIDVVVRLGLPEARRIALAAQGFARPRPAPFAASMRDVGRVAELLGVIQIDSVNVLSRSHYLPIFSRLGPYDVALLDRARDRAPRRLVEYWGHEASLIPPTTWPLLGFRMAAARTGAWGSVRRVVEEHPALVAAVRDEVRLHGPLTSREVEAALSHGVDRSRESWGWNWSLVKTALEFLFWSGEVSSAGRTSQFERRYAAPERVLPPHLAEVALDPAARPSEEESCRALIEMAARALGVATVADLRDYFRLRPHQMAPALDALVGDGTLLPTAVAGWSRPAYLHRAARRPRRVQARALLSPFDSLIWTRERVRALFQFDFKLEIYTPAAQRVHGYYVLPFLLGDRLVGRVDLKADRATGTLRVQQTTWEAGRGSPQDRAELDEELALMATWLDLVPSSVPA